MKGIELSKKYYEEYGAPMLHSEFSEYEDKIAVGICGSGSECFGYDDEVSQDHDFEPGFCIFLPDESVIDRQVSFKLERAYAKLPKEFEGYARSVMGPVGGNRHGVIRVSDFFQDRIGSPNGILSEEQWFSIPEFYLAEATNGIIFKDDSGLINDIRERIKYYPENVRLKKLAGNLLLMAQSGQYNFNRCIRHGEEGAAQLAVMEFAKSTMNTIFLINKVYMPYYKWSFRAMRSLDRFSELADTLEFLITSDNTSQMSETKYDVIEDIASMIIDYLIDNNLTKANCGDLEKHAYSVNDMIEDSNIRNLSVLFAV